MKYTYKVVGTTDDEMASNFYIRPDPTDSSRKGFFITTDPEDMRHYVKKQPKAADQVKFADDFDSGKCEIDPQESEDLGRETSKEAKLQIVDDLHDVERYLHIEEVPIGSGCRIVPRSLVDRKKAQLKLVNRINGKGIRLLDSNWLPQTQSRSGEPYFIRPTFNASWGRKPCIAMIDMSQTWPQRVSRTWRQRIQLLRGNRRRLSDVYAHASDTSFIPVLKRKSEEHELTSHLIVFMLMKGHPT